MLSSNKKVQEFCHLLPKVELHAHLNGSLSNDTLKKLGCVDESVNKYQKLTEIIDKTERTLAECFDIFKIAHDMTSNPESIYLAAESVIKDFAAENVVYLELRTTPRSEQNMSKEEYIESVVKAIKDAQSDILVKLILSIDRKNCESANRETLNEILKMKEKYPEIIKGIDFSGNPAVGNFAEPLFEEARKNGLFTAIHCAEIKNETEVENILRFGPDRIGHGTFLHPKYGGSQLIWDLYSGKQIPIECCLTSNVLCGTSKSYEEHHIQEWIKGGLPFSLSTDDKGVFCTTSSREHELLHQYHNVSFEELWKISLNAIDFAFASPEEKEELKCKVLGWHNSHHSV